MTLMLGPGLGFGNGDVFCGIIWNGVLLDPVLLLFLSPVADVLISAGR